jgi:hypothetical protein
MKANALLISKEASDSNATIAEAAARAGLSLLQAPDAKRAFELLRSGLAEIDLVIIDVDPGIHSMAILEAIAARDTSPTGDCRDRFRAIRDGADRSPARSGRVHREAVHCL